MRLQLPVRRPRGRPKRRLVEVREEDAEDKTVTPESLKTLKGTAERQRRLLLKGGAEGEFLLVTAS